MGAIEPRDPVNPEQPQGGAAEPKRVAGGNEIDPFAWRVSMYHLLLVVVTIAAILFCESKVFPWDEIRRQLFALAFGAIGGTFTASRWVVYAVRHGEYERKRLLWQLLTPIYSAALALVGVVAVRSGILSLAASPNTVEPQFTYFVMTFSFLVGLSSESFLKRLIMAAESLFGERGDLELEDKAGRVERREIEDTRRNENRE
jgi:hypothetical protein